MGNETKVLVSKKGTVSYPAVLEKNQYGKRAATIIWGPNEDLKELEKAIDDAAATKWPPNKKKRPANFHHPIRENDEMDGSDGYVEGGRFAKFQTTGAIKTFGPDGQGPLEEEDVYPGMVGRASYVAKSYSKDGGNGVRLQLVNFQKCAEGTPIGGGIRTEGEEFDPLDDPEVAEALG